MKLDCNVTIYKDLKIRPETKTTLKLGTKLTDLGLQRDL